MLDFTKLLKTLEEQKTYKITSATSNKSLGQLARRSDQIGNQAKSELKRRQAKSPAGKQAVATTKHIESKKAASKAVQGISKVLSGKVHTATKDKAILAALPYVSHVDGNKFKTIIRNAAVAAGERQSLKDKESGSKAKAKIRDLKTQVKELETKVAVKNDKKSLGNLKYQLAGLTDIERGLVLNSGMTIKQAQDYERQRLNQAAKDIQAIGDLARQKIRAQRQAVYDQALKDRVSHSGPVGKALFKIGHSVKNAIKNKLGIK